MCSSCGAELEGHWKYCLSCGAPLVPNALRPDDLDLTTPARMSVLAIIAILLAAIGAPPALVVGHIATSQIRQSGERGMPLARVATVLGYFWLAVWLLVISLWVASAWR